MMILAVSVFETSCGKTDGHTDKRRQKPYSCDCRQRG